MTELSCSQSALLKEFNGKSVSIVGNSRALAEGKQGRQIDESDLVIRINRAPMPSIQSHGSRTTALALATTLSKQEAKRISPDRIMWMSHKRKRLPYWVANRSGFYLHPLPDYQRLKETLGAPPTTGAMVIDLITRSKAKSINLFGFDFFSSLSLTGRRTQAQVPHDFAAERAWVYGLAKHDLRLAMN